MSKITLDRDTFKALASDTRLDILRSLDGKKLSLKDISHITNLNKATLHEHLTKLNQAGLVKKNEREGHKWVYYKLTWKGECLLHPENTRIVVLFTTTFIALWIGIIQFFWYVKGSITNLGYDVYNIGNEVFLSGGAQSNINLTNETMNCINDLGIPNGFGLPESTLEFLKNLLAGQQESAYATRNTTSIPYSKNISWIGDSNSGLVNGDYNLVIDKSEGVLQAVYQDPTYLYIGIACFIVFSIFLCVAIWRLVENKTPKL